MILCHGRLAEGAPFWAYMAIRPADAPHFYEARQRGNLNLEEYGTVIAWGEGEQPPEHIKVQMHIYYGMQDDFEEQLRNAASLHS